MPNTAALQAATPKRAIYLLTGDGTVAGPTIANSVLLADVPAGPLRALLAGPHANQAAMRLALAQNCSVKLTLSATPVDTTGQTNQAVVDVDVDAITPTGMEINCGMSDTTGQVATLELNFLHSGIR